MIYKVMRPAELAEFETMERSSGSADDRRDGFIHFSLSSQLPATLARHFSGEDDLTLLGFESTDFGTDLKWEWSRGGDSFPHVYGTMELSQIRIRESVTLRPDGHQLPVGLP